VFVEYPSIDVPTVARFVRRYLESTDTELVKTRHEVHAVIMKQLFAALVHSKVSQFG